MPRYETVLLDADMTLFDFHRSEQEALRNTLRAFNPVSYTHLTLPTT